MIAGLTSGLGLLPLYFLLTDRWRINRRADHTPALFFVARRVRRCYQVLLYHRVNDARDPFFSGLPVRVFGEQMELLRRYFNVLSLEELINRTKGGDIPPNAIAITFDDGYRDNYENAFPILKRYDLPATIFLATDPLETGVPLWHDMVFEAFRLTTVDRVSFGAGEYPLETVAQKQAAVTALRQHLREFTHQDRLTMIETMTASLGLRDHSWATAQQMGWKEIEEMSKDKITFGAHTVTHPILSEISLAAAVDEISRSKATIERRLRLPVKLFAYPNGRREDYSEAVKGALKEAGFLCAVTTIWGTNDVDSDPFELRRVGIWDIDRRLCALKLGWYRFSAWDSS